MAYEKIVAHPTRSEAISFTENGILTRWALGAELRPLAETVTEYDPVWSDLAVTPDGDELLLVHRTDQVERRRWEDLDILGQIPCPAGSEPHRVAVSVDGEKIGTSGFGVGDYLLDRTTGQIEAVLSGDPGLYMRFSPDGRWLACTENSPEGGKLFLYAITAKGELQGRYALKASEHSSLELIHPVFSPDSAWVSVFETSPFAYGEEADGWFGNLLLFAVEAGRRRWSTSLACPDLPAKIVERAETERLLAPTIHFFRAGEIVCGLPTGALGFYSTETGKPTRQIEIFPGVPITDLSVDVTQQVIWVALDGGQVKTVEVPSSLLHSPIPPVPTPSLPQVRELLGHTRSIDGLAYSRNGERLATISADRTARVWDVATGQELMTLAIGMEAATVAFSRNGSRIAVGGDSLLVYDTVTGQETLRFHDPTLSFRQIEFSPDGQFLLCRFNDRAARLLEAETGQTALILDSPQRQKESAFRWLAYLPDGRYFAAVTESGQVEFRQSPLGLRVSHFLQAEKEVSFLAFSAGGRRCLTGGLTNRVWDVAAGRLLAEHEGRIPACFSPDGALIAGVDDTIFGAKIADALTGKELHRLTGHADSVSCIAFAPDSRHIATGSWDRTIKIWSLPAK